MSDPDLTPAEEQVRRLLAEARHAEPMPDDVAARLDGVLADLQDEPAPPRTPSLPDLAAARRRRNARTWLVAAAAAVAIGIGVNQLDLSMSSNDDSGSASSAADQSEVSAAGGDSASTAKPSASAPEAAAGDAPKDSANGDLLFGLAAGPVTRLDPDRFGTEVRRIGRSVTATAGDDGALASHASSGLRQLAKSCSVPDGPGQLVAVRYDGQRGVLVYRPVRGDTQVVDLFLCDSDEPARSITLPHR